MELCTNQVISNLPNNNKNHGFLIPNSANLLPFRTSLPLKRAPISGAFRSRISYSANSLPRASTSEETSNGVNQFVGEERNGVIALEDVPSVEKNESDESQPKDVPEEESSGNEQVQMLEFLDNLNVKLDSEDTYSLLLYGSGALVAVWLASALVGAIDSIPLFPKLMEVVGLGYTFWFSTRYLLFKKNRDELVAKIEELKQQVLGSNDA